MIYGTTELDTIRDSTNIITEINKEFRHLPYTNQNYEINKGDSPTRVTTKILAKTETEANNIIALLHSKNKENLTFGNKLLKEVVPGSTSQPKPLTANKKDIWAINATFVALDPVIYDKSTGDAIYG